MKKIIVLVGIISLLFFACGKEEPLMPEGESSMVYTPSGNESVLILNTQYFDKKTDDEGKESFQKADFLKKGTSVTLLEGKKYDFKIGNDNYSVGPARLKDGQEVYVTLWYVLPKQRLGVITAAPETRVYTGLDPVNVTDILLPRGTIVGVQPLDAITDENPLQRQRMVCYQNKNDKILYLGTWKTYYIDSTDVSTKEQDLKLAAYLATLKNIKDKSLWNDVLENAIKICPDSIFVPDARKIQQEITTMDLSERETMDVSLSGMINDDDVNVRDEPNEALSNVIGRLNRGETVSVVKRTARRYTVDGDEAFWYQVETEGLSGWVFGKYLDVEK